MSLENKTKLKAVRKKMFGKGAKIVYAYSDAESEQHFKELMRLRIKYREYGGVFKKK